MIRITEMARRTGATPDQIRYLEKKGYVESHRLPVKDRIVRHYEESEIPVIENIVRYLNEGFRYEAAYERALQDTQNPRLI